ncbi:MAG TPA: PTS sugar transporter subunit IIA [Gammaproteobacteria bacterium]|nr:PTS sugar transporter subunit IIA [Gammaproteobacteria bacterium]
MIAFEDIFDRERIACINRVSSKKRVLEELSKLFSRGDNGLVEHDVFNSFCDRERLGGTGLGHGVAIPHGRLPGIGDASCALIKLNEGVDYDVADNQPVDLICGLVVPEQYTDEHLVILSALAEMFSDTAMCARLRSARSSQEIHELLVTWRPEDRRVAM